MSPAEEIVLGVFLIALSVILFLAGQILIHYFLK